MFYESKLKGNKYVWQSKELENKYDKNMLPDIWMAEIKSQKDGLATNRLKKRR